MWTLHTDGGNSHLGGEYAKNVYLGETRIVTKLVSANEIRAWEEVNKIYFYHSDHLGSASLITDENGNEYQRLEYTPYGEVWVDKYSQIQESTALLPYKFTGKERDEETGLYYYGARYLDAKYSRWISTDPALGEYIPAAGKATVEEAGKLAGQGGIFNSVNGNLYHYAANNPIKYTDPDGRVLKVKGWLFFRIKVARDLKKICPSARINIFTGKIYIKDNVNIAGHIEGSELISNLVNSQNVHIIRKTGKGNSAQSNDPNYTEGVGSGSYVNFNPNSLEGGRDSTGSRERPTYVGLAHELGHSEAFDNGTQNFDTGTKRPGTTPPCEINSMKRENDVRAENNQNLRPSYY